MIETYKRQDGEGLGANKVGEGSGRISQSHQKPTTKMISLLKLTILGTDWTQSQLHPCFLHKQMISKSLSSL
jgi:hypothetical protein